MNSSGLSPMEYNVLVKPQAVEEKTKGGLYLPEQVKEKDEFQRTEGELVAVSPVAFTYADWPDGAQPPKVGQTVIFSKYAATEIRGDDGENYWLMKDQNIAAVRA